MRGRKNRNPIGWKAAVATFVLAATFSSGVLAIDGVLSNGGRTGSKNAYSSLKQDLTSTIRSGFQFQSNRNMGTVKSNGKVSHMNSVMSFQKGNVTLNLPVRTRTVANRFQTPSAPPAR